MNRTTLLQERRMQTFQDVLGYWQARRLSALEAAELLGMSERSFRRYRQRYEEEGPDGLFDRRLGKASARRVPADRVDKWTAAPRLTTSPQGQPQQQKRTIDVLQKPAKYTC